LPTCTVVEAADIITYAKFFGDCLRDVESVRGRKSFIAID